MKGLLGTAIVSAIAVTAGACPGIAADYKVGIVQSLTGPAAFIGTSLRDGMLIAADEINKAEALGAGNKLVVSVDDDAGDKNQAVTLLNRLASDPDVLMVLGPTSGAAALTGASAANDLKIPTYVQSNFTKIVEAGPWSFMVSQPASTTIPFITKYAVEKLGVKRCASIAVSDNEAYVILTGEMMKNLKAGGVEIVSEDAIKINEIDFSALGVKVASEDIDCLIAMAPAAVTANMIMQLKQAGLDPSVNIIGHNSLASPDLIKVGGAAVEGVHFIADWAPGGTNDAGKAFVERYRKDFGRDPDNWAPIGYTTMMVAAEALKNAGATPTRESVKDAMTAIKDVPAIIGNGRYSFNEKRVPDYGMHVLTVKDGAFVKAP